MEVCQKILYVNVAKIVKWVDFDSRSPMSSMATGKLVRNWIQEFETALGVSHRRTKLAYEICGFFTIHMFINTCTDTASPVWCFSIVVSRARIASPVLYSCFTGSNSFSCTL